VLDRTCAICAEPSGQLKYCSGRCRSISKNSKRYKRPQRACPGCGLDLTDKHGQVKYCSNACRRWVANGHAEPRNPLAQCQRCGGSKAGKLANAMYCTIKCKLAAMEKRRDRDDRARYLQERERRLVSAKRYAKANPHVGQAAKRKRRSLQADAGVFEVSGKAWLRVLHRHRNRCFYCAKPGPMTMDHVVPISRGGTHSIGNLIPACAQCNSSKRHRTIMEWRLGKRVSLVI